MICSLRQVYRLFVARKTQPRLKSNVIHDQSYLQVDCVFREVDLKAVMGGDSRLKKIMLVLGYLLQLPAESSFLVEDVEMKPVVVARSESSWTKWSAA